VGRFPQYQSCVPGDFCGRSGGHASGDEERGEETTKNFMVVMVIQLLDWSDQDGRGLSDLDDSDGS
jgi:hypothetical protein